MVPEHGVTRISCLVPFTNCPPTLQQIVLYSSLFTI